MRETPSSPRVPSSYPLPLAGVKVLDLTRALAGPFCTMILADLGADVIKVEPAPAGDMIRNWGPHDRGVSTYYLSGNRNKRGLALDFRHREAPGLLRDLALRADVLVENFRPGTMDAMGLAYEDLRAANPGLVYASVTGFGRDGPAGTWPGFDQIAQGYSGLMSVTGSEESGPTRVGVAIGDQTAGMWAALGILAALAQRGQIGVGQRVETSLLAGLVGLLSVQGQRYLSLGEVAGPAGNTHPVISPYGVFRTSDGPLNIAAATDDMWRKLCALLDLEALAGDPRFARNEGRVKHRHELVALLEERLSRHTRAHWTPLLIEAGIPAGPINSIGDVFDDAQVRHCGLVEEIAHPELGPLRLVGFPVRMQALSDGSVRRPPPRLGEHSREILGEYGLSAERIESLLREGVVVQHAASPDSRPAE